MSTLPGIELSINRHATFDPLSVSGHVYQHACFALPVTPACHPILLYVTAVCYDERLVPCRDKDGISVVYSMDSNSDVKSKSCIKVEHGSPVSNRSVSFAAAPNDTPVQRKTKKHMKIRDTKVRDSERLDRLSQKSCDSSSSSTSTDNIPTSCKTVDSRHKPSGAGDAVHYIDISPCGSDSVKDSDVEGAVVNSAAATPVTSVNSDFAVPTKDTSASLEYIQEG